MICCFSIAGVRIKLLTDKDITVSEKMKPFLFDFSEEEDCRITVKKCACIPGMKSIFYSDTTAHHEYLSTGKRIFFSTDAKSPVYAYTDFSYNGNAELYYLPEYENYFDSTASIFNRLGLENILLCHNRLILHSSFITHDGTGILFTAPSGTGKSTQADLWKNTLGAEIINGDRAAIAFYDKKCIAWGIPFAGTSGIYKNSTAPVKAIIILEQGKENIISSPDAVSIFRRIYPEISIHHWDKQYTEKASEILLDIISDTPVFMLSCLPDESAVDCLHRFLYAGGNKNEHSR